MGKLKQKLRETTIELDMKRWVEQKQHARLQDPKEAEEKRKTRRPCIL